MCADLESAKHSIDLEQYILHQDSVTERFFTILKSKAHVGLRVRILCDMVGSYGIYESPVVGELRDAGIDLQFVHPISAWRVTNWTSWFFRDHRKLLIIDDRIAHTGGIGISERMVSWRDTNIRIMGPVVAHMQSSFDRTWMGQQTGKLIKLRKAPVHEDGFSFLTNAPWFRDRRLVRQFSKIVRHSKSYIYLTTPYFVPPFRLFRKLIRAARRGVDVRLLLPLASDSSILDRAAESFFGTAMKSGIRIYRYTPSLLHAKSAIIDDQWATVGSLNLDSQSFVFNHEGNLVITDRECLQDLKAHFLEDITHAQELQRASWEQRSYVDRLLELLTWPAHFLL